MILPSPAVLEFIEEETDDVTEETDTLPVKQVYVIGAVFGTNQQGDSMISYETMDDVQHAMPCPALEEQGRYWASPDGTVRIRDLDPYDAINLAPTAGVAQPVAAIRAALLQGGSLAQELDAVVAADNSVATLMLETGVGTYVRYGGDWQMLSPDSDSLEDMALIAVGPGAVDIWDAADGARTTISVFDLPNPSNRDDGTVYMQEPGENLGVLDDSGEVITASGAAIPEINEVEDLDLAVRYASAHPSARWYVVKRATALDAAAKVPAEWSGGGVVVPFVARAAS